MIRAYLTIFNLYTLGFARNFNLRLRVKNSSIEKINQLKSSSNVLILTKGYMYGRWDYFINVYTKEKEDLLEFITSLYNLWSPDIISYEIYEPFEIYWFPLKIFNASYEEIEARIKKPNKVLLDTLNLQISQRLSNNANCKLSPLANDLHQSVETVKYRLKKLEQDFISSYRIFLDIEKIGFTLSIVSFKINNYSQSEKAKILSFSRSRKNIHAFSYGIGNFNIAIQIIHQNQTELHLEINALKDLFGDHHLDYEIATLAYECMPETFPRKLKNLRVSRHETYKSQK